MKSEGPAGYVSYRRPMDAYEPYLTKKEDLNMKNRRLARFLAIALCAAMSVPAFGGCSSGGEESSSAGSTGSTEQSSAVSSGSGSGEKGDLYIEGSEGVTLTYWIPMDSVQTQNFSTLAEHPYFQWLQEQTGVTIEFIHPSYEQMDQQLNLMIASGEYYDMLHLPNYPGGPQAAIDENCFIDLNDYLDEYMPDYKEALYCSDGSFGAWEWGAEKELYNPQPQPSFLDTCTTFDGSLWCVTQIWTDAYLPESGPVIRKDWLDEAGLDVPQTLDELEVVLEAFKARGEDVVPMNLGTYGSNGGDGSIISAFGLYADYFTMDKEGTTVYPHAYTEDAFLDYLTLMNDWYAKGYIDPDFMNRDDASLEAMFLDDRLGIYFNQWTTPDTWESRYTGDQDFEVVAMPLPRMDTDQQLTWVNGYNSEPTNYTVITSSCEHPEIAAAWLNVGFIKEAILRHTYGIEGEHYELIDGVPYYTDVVFNGDQDYIFSCELFPNSAAYNSYRSGLLRSSADSAEVLSPRAEALTTWAQNASRDTVWKYVVFADDGWGEFDSALNDALTYAQPMVLRFIIGEESLDNFDTFRETAKSMGLDKAQQAAQAALDVMNQSAGE